MPPKAKTKNPKKPDAPKTPSKEKPSVAAKKKAGSQFDLLGDTSFASTVKEGLLGVKGVSIIQARNPREGLLHIPALHLQCILRTWGFLNGTIIDVLGGEGLGKTALMMTVGGWAMSQNSPFLYVETENKPIFDLSSSRVLRCLHTDPVKAQLMFDRGMTKVRAFVLLDAIKAIETWAIETRKVVPKHVPIVAALDTFSKLMGSSEAAALALYGDDKDIDEEKIKELGGGSNFEHAKIAQAWCRRLPAFLSKMNMILFLARHQNEKVEMAQKFGGGGIVLAPDVADTMNKTSRGGKAFGQSAALQLILSRGKQATATIGGQTVRVGENIKLTVAKSSFGPGQVKMDYRLMTVARRDTPDYQEPVLQFDVHFPEWLFVNKLLTMTKKNLNCYSCKELGLLDATAEEFTASLEAHPDVMARIGVKLDMIGYSREQGAPPKITPENASQVPQVGDPESSEGSIREQCTTAVEAAASADSARADAESLAEQAEADAEGKETMEQAERPLFGVAAQGAHGAPSTNPQGAS